jgi:nucleotide-binding universal stress UspA family protein
MTTGKTATRVAGEEQYTENEGQHPYRHVVVALDGSELAERVFEHVLPLARAFGSKVTCVCAVEPISSAALAGVGMGGGVGMDSLLDAQDEVEEEDAAYLAQVKDRLDAKGIEVTCEEPEGPAAKAIIECARQVNADLIAMTTHGRSGLGRAVLGSVADEVVRKAPCPVLLVRLQ